MSPARGATAPSEPTAAASASPTAPAVAGSRPAGIAAMEWSAGSVTYSAKPPACSGWVSTTPKTSSPAAKLVTPAPTSSIAPAKSRPRITGKRCSMKSLMKPPATARSNPFSDDDRIFTLTSPGPGVGVGTVTTDGAFP